MALPRIESVDAALGWLAEHGVQGLATDSRTLAAGDAFIAWPGAAHDARRHVAAALAAGARACLVEADGADAFELPADGRVATMAGLKAASGEIASGYYGRPSERLAMLAVTGTNGKTSSAWWIAQALSALGRRCGVVGTLGIGEPPSSARPHAAVVSTGLTTPDPVTLQHSLRDFVDQGYAACAIEASSIGIVEHRLAGTRLLAAVFTNFTQDHLDYHGSMEAYWQAKAALFDWPGLRMAAINIDDAHGAALARTLEGRAGLDLWTCSMQGAPARLRAANIGIMQGGLAFAVHEDSGAHALVHTQLVGSYNVANLLGVIAVLRGRGIALDEAARVAATLTPVPGRMQRVAARVQEPQIVVDYAHTPDALEQALRALQPYARERGGRLWCVFGCGGNRDAAKRAVMGEIATRLAQRVVITSDNPRLEPPGEIVAQIAAGASGKPDVIVNRSAAIAHAVLSAMARDVILIAGKGHEDYQDIGGTKLPFLDVAEAEAALRRRRGEVAA
ncbi:MAG: UDP-N-acetylmuramoyl-L-alanyl-D-glutamate--2,6-diaminopimelate ligase [Proteobacteria bacterium]|nr:UDP-N-acetylmuramoyl-L-alanyl-D-glutamate--2,6-diaminopimelate ligase [Pseudomonadota bacterium]